MNILLDRGRTSVGLSAHRLPRCQASRLAHRPSTRSGRPVRRKEHSLLLPSSISSSGHRSPKGKANILLILNQQEKERNGVTQTAGQRASWLMFTGVHLSVIVNDWNKVAPVTDLSRVRLGQETLTTLYFYLFWMHYNNIYPQWKRLGRLHVQCWVDRTYKTFIRSTFFQRRLWELHGKPHI